MKNSDLLISHNKDYYEITVSGRANFEYGVPMRRFAKTLENQHVKKLIINLRQCLGMDSTFMGILTMLALKMKKQGAIVEITNISDSNRELLRNLGIDKLFIFPQNDDRTSQETKNSSTIEIKRDNSALDMAKTVIDAHETLMKADSSNIPKFAQVTKFAHQDAERLEKKADQ